MAGQFFLVFHWDRNSGSSKHTGMGVIGSQIKRISADFFVRPGADAKEVTPFPWRSFQKGVTSENKQ